MSQKHGVLLLGISLTSQSDDNCSFQHKVALFARGNQLQGKTFTYRASQTSIVEAKQGRTDLVNIIKQSIERVGASSQSLVTTEQDLKSEHSKSVLGDQSFTNTKTPEIEDIMMTVPKLKLEEVVVPVVVVPPE